MRQDAGFFDQELLPCLEERDLSYIVVAPLTGPRFRPSAPDGGSAEKATACYLRRFMTTCLSSVKMCSSNSPR